MVLNRKKSGPQEGIWQFSYTLKSSTAWDGGGGETLLASSEYRAHGSCWTSYNAKKAPHNKESSGLRPQYCWDQESSAQTKDTPLKTSDPILHKYGSNGQCHSPKTPFKEPLEGTRGLSNRRNEWQVPGRTWHSCSVYRVPVDATHL